MILSDPISDMLTRIRNAGQAGHDRVKMPHSKVKSELARILKQEGYIRDCTVEKMGGQPWLVVHLKQLEDGKPVIQGLRRVSRPGRRYYVPAGNIPRVLGGIGTAVLSTSAGVMTGVEARRAHTGGEVLCYIW